MNAFLTHLAVDRNVAASTQSQTQCAILCLYAAVLKPPPNELKVVRGRRPKRLPVVLTRDEGRRVLDRLDGLNALLGRLLYGTGMRLLECLRLRAKDVDFGLNQLTIRECKGNKDRVTMLFSAVGAGSNPLVRVPVPRRLG